MLKNAILFAVSGVVLAAFAPMIVTLLQPEPPHAAAKSEPAAPPPAVPQVAARPASNDREVSIPADARGQYMTDALLNGQSVHMMVDTGASYVMLSARVAERLGLHQLVGEPRGLARTANGNIEVTPVELSTVAIGSIFMTRVRGYVLDRSAGEVNLIGANFLKQLVGVEQRDGWLFLRQ